MSPYSEKHLKQGQAWSWFILAGVLVVILGVLAVSTQQRLLQSEEIMLANLSRQADFNLRSLEGATRASLRQGMLRGMMLQALVEEMSDHPKVISLMVLGPKGKVIAMGSRDQKQKPGEDPLASLPESVRKTIARGQPVEVKLEGELVVGRPFRPLSRPPHWAGRGRGLGPMPPNMGMGMGYGMGMHLQPPPPPRGGEDDTCPPGVPRRIWRNLPENIRNMKAYVLARVSTSDYQKAKLAALHSAFFLGGLIFLGAGAAAWGLWVTARRRSKEIERLRREVAESQHMASVGRLAGSVAHEVRNPLSALRGLVQFLAKGKEEGSREAQYAAAAVEEVDRLERVVSGLLDYTRPKEPRRLSLDLVESVESAVTFMQDDPRAEGVEIKTELPREFPALLADPDQIRQVLVNLIINALEALNGRGELLITLAQKDAQAIIRVDDSGPGLPEGEPERLFDPFFSQKERGTGLGLAIAKRIMTAHRGSIAAGASPLGGARFTLTLPMKKAEK